MRNKRGSFLITLGLLLLVSAGGLSAYNLADAYYAGMQAQEALAAFDFLQERNARNAAPTITGGAGVQKDLMGLPLPAGTQLTEMQQETTQTNEAPAPLEATATQTTDTSATEADAASPVPGTPGEGAMGSAPGMQETGPAGVTPGTQDAELEIVPGLEFPSVSAGEIEIPDYILNPKMDMPVTKANGQSYIGVLEIPSLGLTLPVISEWDYARLKKAPCRYAGSAYTDDLVIAAHNYKSHFGNLKQLVPGSRVSFTDAVGNRFEYRVVLTETLMPNDVEEMKSGEFDLSLFTCTVGGSYRVTVRCDRLY